MSSGNHVVLVSYSHLSQIEPISRLSRIADIIMQVLPICVISLVVFWKDIEFPVFVTFIVIKVMVSFR